MNFKREKIKKFFEKKNPKQINEFIKVVKINNIFLLLIFFKEKNNIEPIIFPKDENRKNKPKLKSDISKWLFISKEEEGKSPEDMFINIIQKSKIQYTNIRMLLYKINLFSSPNKFDFLLLIFFSNF